MPHARHPFPNPVDAVEIVAMNTQDACAAVPNHENEVLSRQTVVDGHDNRPELRYRVVLLEMLMRVGRNRRDAVTLDHAQFRECGAPLVASLAELGVRKP